MLSGESEHSQNGPHSRGQDTFLIGFFPSLIPLTAGLVIVCVFLGRHSRTAARMAAYVEILAAIPLCIIVSSVLFRAKKDRFASGMLSGAGVAESREDRGGLWSGCSCSDRVRCRTVSYLSGAASYEGGV